MEKEVIEEKRVESEEGKRWESNCSQTSYWDLNFTQYGPGKMIFPASYGKWASYVREMPVRKDDVWIVSFPKCGTTWTQEMAWLLANDLDFETAKTVFLEERFMFLEIDGMSRIFPKVSGLTKENKPPTSMEIVSNAPTEKPRFIKSHLPLSLLPKQLLKVQPKIIYVTRNPKDACVSYFHHTALVAGYSGTLDDFAQHFITDNVVYCPYWPNLKAFYDLHVKNHPNLLFLTFEEMKKDLKSVILRTADFLGEKVDAEDVKQLEKHLSFEEMKKNPAVNMERMMQTAVMTHKVAAQTQFMRKGEVGSYKTEMSAEWIAKFDAWIDKNKIPRLFDV